jgi:hypothetical protein
MKPDRLIVEISSAAPARVDYLERRAMHTPMSEADRAAVKRAIAERRAYLSSPEFIGKLLRTL